jgi:hypothetical protein
LICRPGRYDVRVAYCGSENRTTQAEFTVFSADGETTIVVNQRKPASIDGLWQSLGEFRFEPAGQAFVMLSNSGADGHVIADAVQFLPVQSNPDLVNKEKLQGNQTQQVAIVSDTAQDETAMRLEVSLKQLVARQSQLQKQLNQRPKAMGLRRRENASDLPIHIRGSIHNLGQPAQRGTLQVISGQLPRLKSQPIPVDASSWPIGLQTMKTP